MNTLSLPSREWGKLILPRHLLLVVTLGREKQKITELIATLVLRGPLRIVAGSDWLPAYDLSRRIRRRISDIKRVLNRLYVTRAFTCYQVVDLLEGMPPDRDPLLILDFLHNFYDPDIPLATRLRLINQCSRQIQRLSFDRPVALMIQQVPGEDYQAFYAVLLSIAGEVIQAPDNGKTVSQPQLL